MGDRILLVCPEPLGHGRPAGVGIRFLEITRVLLAESFDVTLISPDGASPDGASGRALSPSALAEESRRASAALVQGHVANDFFAHADRIPTVVDMYDPYLIENLSYSRSDPAIWAHDWETTVRSLRRGDFFLCASARQRAYYLGWLAALGRINPASFDRDTTATSLLEVAPFGVPPARTIPDRSLETPSILFGGVYDWYDPVLAIEAAAIARRRVEGLTLTFVSHPNAETTPQSKFAEARRFVEQNRLADVVHFRDWFSYGQRAKVYDSHVAAMLTFPHTLETELSFRTRILDYLWGGLPVLSSSAAGTDEILDRYQAGVIVENDAAGIAERLVDLVSQPAPYRSLVEGTQRFVRDYQWSALLSPLLRFFRNPAIDSHAEEFVRLEATAQVSDPGIPERAMRRLRRLLGS